MKYIEKHMDSSVAVAYQAELHVAQLDRASLSDANVHLALNGADVYDMVKSLPTFNGMKRLLFADQGGICCYCGCRLQYPTHPQYIVEHVFPKEKDRTLAGEYGNLLLSCRPSDQEERERMSVPKKERKHFFHCDKSKGADVLSINPLQMDCPTHFKYDEFGGIEGDGEVANKDIATLNLGCEWLCRRREAAIEGAIYDEDGNLLSDDELRQQLNAVMRLDAEGMHAEFCFVIKNVIERLLS